MTLAIHRFTSPQDLFSFAAIDFLAELKNTLEKKTHFDVALPGGETAQQFFLVLKNMLVGNKNLSSIRFFFSDERTVPLESKDSNAGNAYRILLEPLAIEEAQFFPMYNQKNSAAHSAQEYENILLNKLLKNSDGVPVFDLIYLGIGGDGHTASLFPHSVVFKENDLVCAVAEKNISHQRITFMPKLINNASRIIMMATGASKASIIRRIIDGPANEIALPAQMIMKNPQARGALLLAI